MSPVREAREVKTRETARPESRPLPAAWTPEAGMLVHTSGAQLEDIDTCTDDDLCETEEFAADVVSLMQWKRRERAVARWTPGPGPEAA